MLRVEIEIANRTVKAQLYNTWFEGKKIVRGSKDPESDSCRALKGLGKAGGVGFFIQGSTILRLFVPCLTRYAQKRVVDHHLRGLSTVNWEPYTPKGKTTKKAKEKT